MAEQITAAEVLREDIELFNRSIESTASEKAKTQGKVEALTKVVSAIHKQIKDKVDLINDKLDEIKAFHDARLNTASDLNALNSEMETFYADDEGNVSSSSANLYSPYTSQNARDINSRTVWRSNLEKTPTLTNVSSGGETEQQAATFSYRWGEGEGSCAIELNEKDHWNGEDYRPEPKLDQSEDADPGDYEMVGDRIVFENVPVLVCPDDKKTAGSNSREEPKVIIRLYGYDYEGENPVEIYEEKLKNGTLGLGTISVYEDDFFSWDVGVNANTNSWTAGGQTYPASTNPMTTDYVTSRLAEIAILKEEIKNTHLPDVNAVMEVRKRHELHLWSLEYVVEHETEKIVNTNEILDYLLNSEIDRALIVGNPTGNLENEVTNKPFEEYNVPELQDLAETYGLGFPKQVIQTEIETLEDGTEVERFLQNPDGSFVIESDNGFNRNYDEEKVREFLRTTAEFNLSRDNIKVTPGSIIIVDSTGDKTTYTGITTQINKVSSGGMSSTNVFEGEANFELADFTGITTSWVIEPPGAGLGITYSGKVGIGTTAQFESMFARTFYGHLRGSAHKVEVGIITAQDNYDYPLLFSGISVNDTQGITSTAKTYAFPGLYYNAQTGQLSVDNITVENIEVSSGAVGAANSILLNDSSSFPSYDNRGLIGFVTSGIGTYSKYYVSNNFNFDPDTEELFAPKFIGIGSFTSINAGLSTFSDIEFTNSITLTSTNKFKLTDDGGTPEIRADKFYIRDFNDTVSKVYFGDAATNHVVRLYYNGSERLSTTDGGIFVQGTVGSNGGANITGIITAITGIEVGSLSAIGATIFSDGGAIYSGIITSTFSGDLTAEHVDVGTALTVATNTVIDSTGIDVEGTIDGTSLKGNYLQLSSPGIGTFSEIDVTNVSVTNFEATSIGTISNLKTTNSINSGISSVTGQQVVNSSEIEILEVLPLELTSLGDAVNATFDTIIYQTEEYLRIFDDGDLVQYISPSGDSYSGLTDGGSYYVQNVGTGNSIKLYTDSGLTTLIDIDDASSPSGIHTFRKVSTGIATITTLSSTDTTIDDILTVSGLATITNAYVGYATANNLEIEGPSLADRFNVTNFVYDKSTGVSTVTIDANLTFEVGDTIRFSGIAFTCSDEHLGVTTTIFPDGTQGFEYPVNQIIDTRNFVTNVGVSTIGHTYDSGGVVSFGLNNKFKFPTVDGKGGQYMVTDGIGNLKFQSPDQLAGNRLYVSAKFGNDLNDGVNGPLKTIKKACELSSALAYETPVTIYVASGNYVEDNPLILPDNTSVVGDGLRRGIVRPKNPAKDIFRVRNACYITNLQFRDNVTFPTATFRNDILDKAVEYAKILINQESGSATTYRSITATTSPVVAAGSTVDVSSRIDDLIELSKDTIEAQQTQIPSKSSGNVDQEFIDAGDLIINNLGSSADAAGSGYIPGNSVGWSTAVAGGNFALTDEQISEFESNVFNVLYGIAEDLKYGGKFGTEFTSKRLKNIVVPTPQFTWDFAVAFDDPLDTDTDRTNYVGLSSDIPRITQSPYIQNCSIISFLGGNGCNVDGSKIQPENIPIVAEEAENPALGDVPDQGKSMVANAFTTVSFGGIGWKVSNSGYAQIVSCFQIFCQIGSYAQSGGYLSITNSATNFGIYALRSSGFRTEPFDFDKGIILETGSDEGVQTIKVGGLGRSDQELYVLRFIRALDDQDRTQDFKIAGITTTISETGINSSTDVIDIGEIGNSISDGDGLLYNAPNPQSVIGGLVNDANYYVKLTGVGNTQANLYVDEDLKTLVDITSAPVGIHTFTKVAEEFFVSEITTKHRIYQNLTLSNVIGTAVTFNQGTAISQVRSDSTVAVGFAITWTDTKLTVSVEDSTNTAGDTEKLLFQTTAVSGNGINDVNNLGSDITATETRSDLNTINFKVGSTIEGSSVSNISILPTTYRCNLHRPSIVNSSAHTWEYAGSGTDYNALPQNGGQTREEFEQYSENGGRVFSSGTNELGDFKVGDAITAFNRTGNIVFNNTVSIGQLDALELSLSSGISITEISASQELGTDESGGPADNRLITQKSVYNYLQNHLGNFIDVNKATAPVPSAVPQLNSQGLLDAGMIPASIRFNNVFQTNVAGGRTDFVNEIPAGEILKSDIVTESVPGIGTENYTLTFENESQFLVLSSNTESYEFEDGDQITASQNGATGIVTAATHVGYGTTGYVRGVLTSVSLTDGGDGYSTAGIYTGVNLISTTGIGTSATADITVNTSGEVENINLRIGGRYYQSGDTFIVDPDDIGGASVGFTTFTASVATIATRLYLKLTGDKTQFFASQSLPDFISDSRSGTISTSFTESLTVSFNPQTIGAGGSIFLSENCILLPPGHGLTDGDVVKYEVTAGSAVANLQSGSTYYVRNVGVSSIRLADDYAGNVIVDLTSTGTGTHQLIRSGVSTERNRIHALNHGFTTGNSVQLVASDPPAGSLTNNYYFVGSVSTNAFTLHDVRQDALTSVNGQTFNEINLTDTGSGTGDFNEQNVTFVNAVNTSSNNPDNFSILAASADIDASNVVSGVLSPQRLASGTPNNTTFLRGDSSWEYAVQTLTVGTGNTSALVVRPLNPAGTIAGTGINTYFGNLELEVTGVSTTGVGASEFTKLGVSRYRFKQDSTNLGPFKVTGTDSKVELQTTVGGTNNNGIDAYTFFGQSLANIIDLSSNSVGGAQRNVLRSGNGGTGINNNGASQGSVFVCSLTSPGRFTATVNPTIAGKVGIGFYSSNSDDIKGTIDLDQKVSIDVAEITTSQTSQIAVYTFDKTVFRTGKFIISITDTNSNYYHATECLITHDDTNALITIYSVLFTNGQLATFTADVSGDNVRLLATPVSTNQTNFKISAISLIRV